MSLNSARGSHAWSVRLIASQRDYIASLERSGRDPTQAKTLLDAFIELQLMHLASRDRLRGQLEASGQLSRPH